MKIMFFILISSISKLKLSSGHDGLLWEKPLELVTTVSAGMNVKKVTSLKTQSKKYFLKGLNC